MATVETTLFALYNPSSQEFLRYTPDTCCDEGMHEDVELRCATLELFDDIKALQDDTYDGHKDYRIVPVKIVAEVDVIIDPAIGPDPLSGLFRRI